MTQPVGKPHTCVLGNLTKRPAEGDGSRLLSLPPELLHAITGYVAKGATPQAAATNAIRWGRVSVSTHFMTHESPIENVINHARHLKHLDEALVILWQHGIVPVIGTRLAPNAVQMTSAEEIRGWMMDPINLPLLDTIAEIQLSNKGLKVIPPEINNLRVLDTLRLEDNQIAQIYPQAFAGCLSLEHLYLHNNQITQIHPQAFTGCTALLYLYLYNNQIAQIHPQAFTGCTALQTLGLSNNQINQLAPQTFAGCTALLYLYLRNNQITQVGPQAFAGCLNLQAIDLDNNQITQIYPQAFAGCRALQYLGLEHNKIIAQIHPQAFAGCLNLAQLYLNSLCTLKACGVNCLEGFKAFSEYVCRSELATFYKALSEGTLPESEIVERLKHLEDRNLIYEMVYWEAKAAAEEEKRAFSTDGDLQWGEHHVCDNMPIFYRALRRAVQEKYNRLSAEQKHAVHVEIAAIAAIATLGKIESSRWGEDNREENVLRFIDAMKGLS